MKRHLEEETRQVSRAIANAVEARDPVTGQRLYPQIHENAALQIFTLPELAGAIIHEHPIAAINLILTHPALERVLGQVENLWKVLLYRVLFKAANAPIQLASSYAMFLLARDNTLAAWPFLKREWRNRRKGYRPSAGRLIVTETIEPLRLFANWPFGYKEARHMPFQRRVQLVFYDAVARAWVNTLTLLVLVIELFAGYGLLDAEIQTLPGVNYGLVLIDSEPGMLNWWDPDATANSYFCGEWCLVQNHGDPARGAPGRGSARDLQSVLDSLRHELHSLNFHPERDGWHRVSYYRREHGSREVGSIGAADRPRVSELLKAIRTLEVELRRLSEEDAPLEPLDYREFDDEAQLEYEKAAFGLPEGPYASAAAQKQLLLAEMRYLARTKAGKKALLALGAHYAPLLTHCSACRAPRPTKTHALLSLAFCGHHCWTGYKAQHQPELAALSSARASDDDEEEES